MTLRTDVSALYVDPRGPYPKLLEDWWDEKRDARLYAGPNPVIAHPPCERWGRYWGGGPMIAKTERRRALGDDAGCFAAAVRDVERFGGVIEHPEASHAFEQFGLGRPKWREGWTQQNGVGWVCCVAQGNYGHRSRKLTWLYFVGPKPTPFDWTIPPPSDHRLDDGFHPAEERRKAVRCGVLARLTKFERRESPPAFAELLIQLASTARKPQ